MKTCYNKNCSHCSKNNTCWCSNKIYKKCEDKITERNENSSMSEIKLNIDNLNETEREQLMVLVEKANRPRIKSWKPKEDEKYFLILADGEIHTNEWHGSRLNNELYSIGNCFQTKEQAEWTVEHLKVRAELQRFAEEHNTEPINWDNDNQQWKYFLEHCCWDNYYKIGKANGLKFADTAYFTSREIAEQAIEAIGEERLKKYYFGVED